MYIYICKSTRDGGSVYFGYMFVSAVRTAGMHARVVTRSLGQLDELFVVPA